MKKLLLIAIAYFLPVVLFAQEPVYEWGTSMPDETYQAGMTGIIHSDSSGFYVLRDNKSMTNRLVFLEKYDHKFKFIFSELLIKLGSQGVMGNSMLYRKLLTGKDKFLIFSQGWNKAAGKGSYTVKTVTTDGKIDSEFKELESISAEKELNAGFYHPALSPDKSKLLILTELPFEKDGKEKIRISVFDANTFNKLWAKDVTLTFESKRGVNNEGFVDNNGNVYVLKKFEEKSNLIYTLFTCDAIKKEWKDHSLDLQGKKFSHFNFIVNNGNAIFFGFYYSKFDTDWEGLFYYRFNHSLAMEIKKVEPFGTKFLQNFMDEKAASKEGASLKDFVFRDALPMKPGGNFLIIAEEENIHRRSLPAVAGQTTPSYEYSITCDRVLVLCLNKDGAITWQTVVPKKQRTTTKDPNERWDSFVYGLVDNRLYLIWNNIDLTPYAEIEINPEKWTAQDGKTYYYKTAFDPGFWDKKGTKVNRTTVHPTFMYIIEANGSLTYSNIKYGLTLFNLHKDNPFPMSLKPNMFFKVDDGIIIMSQMHSGSKYYRFGRIKL